MEEVQKILDADIDSDSDDDNQYLVQWKKGLRSQWVLEEDCNCPNAIFEYEKEQGVNIHRFACGKFKKIVKSVILVVGSTV